MMGTRWTGIVCGALACALTCACGSGGSSDGNGATARGADAGAGADGASLVPTSDGGYATFGGSDGGSGPVVMPTGPVDDFPSPVFDGTAPPSAPALFGPVGQGAPSGGPCLTEPGYDVLFPQNWLRPRFVWSAPGGEDLFELRLHVANEIHDLVVYTTETSWTMPAASWDALRTHSPTEAMTITVRGGVLAGSSLQDEAQSGPTPMGIAPVPAAGAIVYWTTNDQTTGSSDLKGFVAGQESVQEVLSPTQYAQAQSTTSSCIGCHTSAPDGQYVALTTTSGAEQQWTDALAGVDPDAGTIGAAPSYVGAAGAQALARPNVGAAAFSPAHWQPGDRRAIVSYDDDGAGTDVVLSWVDVEATAAAQASGTLAITGDTQLAAAPAWSHDGQHVAYVSTNRACTGRLGNCTPQYDAPQDVGSRAEIRVVPYAGGAGGTSTPLQGASDPSWQEAYPSYSPDDRWIVFNRLPNDDNLYDQPASEVYVVPAAGGAAVRLAANDPPACSGQTSPGLTNSWAKWGPTAPQAGGLTYYWVVFSSKRTGVPQLYITALVQQADGTLVTHGAGYLWNQPATEANHTPAWDAFQLPPPPPTQ